VVDRRVVEGVQGAAVDHEAPVDARGLHLGAEGVPLRGRHDRVLRPDAGPHRAADARRLARSAGGQPVDRPDRAQVDAVAPDFQRDGAPGAVADGSAAEPACLPRSGTLRGERPRCCRQRVAVADGRFRR
jgi:hypothetical protein